jgi:hypothetical protein
MDMPEILANPVETMHSIVSPTHRKRVAAGKKGAAVRKAKRASQARSRSLSSSKKRGR